MKRSLIILVTLLLNISLFGQPDADFEIGVEHVTKKITVRSGNKNASMFLDGQFVGHEKAKVVIYSQQQNLLVTTFATGEVTTEYLNPVDIGKEHIVKPVALAKAKKQDKAYFDSIFVLDNYQIEADKFIGWNEKEELYWQSPSSTALTSNDRLFTDSQVDFLSLYGIPSGDFGFDTASYKHQVIFTTNEVLINIQDDFGYVHLKFSVVVLNTEGQEIFSKELFGVKAVSTSVYPFKKAVNEVFQMGLTELLNDYNFISSIKRTNKREHKKQQLVIVAALTKDSLVAKGDSSDIQRGFSSKYMNSVARLKTDKGLFVGFVIAETGYLLTNENYIGDTDDLFIKVKGQRTVKGKVLRRGTKTGVVLVQVLANKKFSSLELAEASPQKNDTVYSVMPGKSWEYHKGTYQDEVAVFGNFYHTVKIIPGKSTDGTPVLNENGEVIGILNSKIAGNSKQKIEFIIPIKDALEDLNLKLE
jgi:hypothetical protein